MNPEALQAFLRTMNRDDFDALVRSEAGLMHAAARTVSGDAALAEDAVQEVFVKLLEAPPRAEEVGVARGWLLVRVLGIARGLARAERRRDQRERDVARAEAERRPAAEAVDAETVRAALTALPEEQRAVVELRYFGALSSEEIGRTLGCARRTVDERLAAARERLRRTLASEALGALFLEVPGAPLPAPGPASLARKLHALRTHPALRAEPVSLFAPGTLLLAVVALLGVAGIAWIAGGEDRTEPGAVVPLVRASEAQAPSAPGPGGREERTAAVSPTAALAANAQPPIVVAGERPATGALRVHVVDAGGAHVRTGELRLEPASFAASAAVLGLTLREDLARFEFLLDPIPLAGANPLEVRDLPAEIVAQDFRAFAVVPGYGTPEPAAFRIAAGATCELRLVLPAPRDVVVAVEDAVTHAPIADASVVSVTELERRDQPADEALRQGSVGAATTDASGLASLAGLGAGPHTLEVHARGHASAKIDLAEGLPRIAVELARAPATATVRFDVVDGAHYGMPGVEVVGKAIDRELVRRATSDEWGKVVFQDLEPGYWSFTLDALQFAQACAGKGWELRDVRTYAPMELAASEVRREELGFLFGTASWAVRVVDAAGAPVRDAAVRLNGPSQREERTNAAGWTNFEALPSGRWHLDVSGWTHLERELGHHDLLRDSIALGSDTLSGTVRDAAGRPVQGAMVLAQHAASGARASTHSGADGTFAFHSALAGAYELDAADRTGSSGLISVTVTAASTRRFELQLRLH